MTVALAQAGGPAFDQLREPARSTGRAPVEAGQLRTGKRNLHRLRRHPWPGGRRGGPRELAKLRFRLVTGRCREDVGDGARLEIRRRLDRGRQLLERPADVAELDHGRLAAVAAGQVMLKRHGPSGLQRAQHQIGDLGPGEVDVSVSRYRYVAAQSGAQRPHGVKSPRLDGTEGYREPRGDL